MNVHENDIHYSIKTFEIFKTHFYLESKKIIKFNSQVCSHVIQKAVKGLIVEVMRCQTD